jgi:multicomponent Na+:H+ antiporter subunit D
MNPIPPEILLIGGALFVPLLRGWWRRTFLLVLPGLTFVDLLLMPAGTYWDFKLGEYTLILGRVDALSLAFGYIFVLITGIGLLYALHLESPGQQVAALIYAGGALGVTFAGDLISLYIFWELLALASTFLILARRSPEARRAAYRYFMWHFGGGLLLLAGIILYVSTRGTTEFGYIGLSDPASALILAGFCLNAAIFPLHAWLPDAYPRATVCGAVFMSALTTKTAVYVLTRSFAGTTLLVWAGAFMTCFPIFYAVIVNDMRRVLAYSLINQVGFMVCGIGIGSQLALNGVVAHAFCHIIYKALLFMSAGAVLHMTGKIRATDLGGLHKTMPFTAICCMIGAASISAFPLFSGFVSKSMTVSAAAEAHLTVVWFMMMFASAGVFHHAGIKVPYFIFFGHDAGIRSQDPPWNMCLAMGVAAALCLILGIWPAPLYRILPFPVLYEPYTAFHVLGMLELLLFGALAFTVLILSGYYPPELRATNLDTDWFARKGGRIFIWFCKAPVRQIDALLANTAKLVLAVLRTGPLKSKGLESAMDDFFHKGLVSIPHFLLNWGQMFKTEARQLAWNLIYILSPFILLLALILLM